ncbi:MAG: 3-dehydroquinate synthase II [Candidatus Lokiarchaeota archaeon]|nr:3-dehydroquinate synthase II [Candidatus Lokiarchaeota archaeon]
MKDIILNITEEWQISKPIVVEALLKGLNKFKVEDVDLIEKIRGLGAVHIFSSKEGANPDIIVISKEEFYKNKNINLEQIAIKFVIKDKSDEESIKKCAEEKVKYLIIEDFSDWKVIPIENLISEIYNKSSKLIVNVKDMKEAKLMLETLELGTDGIVIEPKSLDILEKLSKLKSDDLSLELTSAIVTEIKEIGMGDRVCVDTCSMLKAGEGMLIGSQSRGMFLVHAEVFDTEFVASRPFRVNAGPVASYVLLPTMKTEYLSELEAGKEVLICDYQGNCKIVLVARSKIEKRPMLLIKAKVGDDELKVILQNAETIRVVLKDGKAISVHNIKVGDEILVHYQHGGRHFGKLVEKESIIEK